MSTLETMLCNDFGDRYLYSVNRNAFNRIGSNSLYRSLYGDKLLGEYELNIVVGTDSGLLPAYIVKNGIPNGTRYIFVELPEVLKTLADTGALAGLPPEISIGTLDSFGEITARCNFSEYIFLDAVRVHESVAARDANLPEYRDLSWALSQQITKTTRRTWAANNASQFILRQLENLAENRCCFIETLKDAFPGKTAVLLAGGPSLRPALPWVKENRERLLVIAVSRISRLLLEEGVIPNIITSVDPQKISFEVSREMLNFPLNHQTPLFVSSYHASPLLISQWQGKNVFTGPRFPWRSPLNVDPYSYSGPTVSNYSFDLAAHMGCSTLVLAGVDLCFSAEGQTHAAGSNENKIGPDLGQVNARVETYGNGWADTNPGYAESLHVLGQQASRAAAIGMKLYNCSLNSAKVPSIEYKPLEEIELEKWDEDPTEMLTRLIPDSTAATRLIHYRQVKKEIEKARKNFQEILNLCQEALQCADGLFGKNGRKADFRHKIRMDKIERKLDQTYKGYTWLVHHFGLRKFCASLRTTMDEMTDEQVESATYEYYEAYVAGTQELIEVIDGTLERIEARIEEDKDKPDFGKLLAQWQNDTQFGRLQLWRERYAAKAQLMQAQEPDAVGLLESEFERVMTEERTSQIALLEELHDVRHTRSKALLLFKRRETEELASMATGLEKHPDQEKALPYLHFIKGLLSELHGEPAEAVASYQHLFTDPPHALTEDALLQVAHLSMAANEAENALLALECLVGVSPTYLPPYGELLKAVGDFEGAFHAFNRYLSFAPEDVGALVTLAMFCKEAGLTDAAGELFQRVLEQDPENNAALSHLGGNAAAGAADVAAVA